MKKIPRLLAVAVILLGFTIPASADDSLQTNDLAIVGARIYTTPDAEPIEDGVVVIRAGKIVSVGTRKKIKIPCGIQVIKGEGNILTAGFWNSHVHLLSPAQLGAAHAKPEILRGELQAMLTKWGFTTVFDVASSTKSALALKRRMHPVRLLAYILAQEAKSCSEPMWVTPIFTTPRGNISFCQKS